VDWSALAAAAPPSGRSGSSMMMMYTSYHHSPHTQITDIVKNIRRVANLEGVEANYNPKGLPNLTLTTTKSSSAAATDTLLSSVPGGGGDPWVSYLPSYLKDKDKATTTHFGKYKKNSYFPKSAGSMIPVATDAMTCSYCTAPCVKMSIMCRKCETRRYCSKNCQYADWLHHKKQCLGSGTKPEPEPAPAASSGALALDSTVPPSCSDEEWRPLTSTAAAISYP
jgi:hypothetical protein